MQLGTFTRDGEKFTGTIATLALKAKATIQPVSKASDNAPDFRVYVAGVEIGAAWTKTSQANREYLSVKIDDPSFAQPLACRLIERDEGGHALVWNR